MIHLFLTDKCNLHCNYCFASEYFSKRENEFSIYNLKKVIEFIKKDNSEEVGLLGGEPFFHSKIDNILKILNNDKLIKTVIIYTNGTINLNKHEILKNQKFKILINCNSPNIIGEKNYRTIIKNIEFINNLSEDKISIGINLPYINFDYNYIFKILKKFNKKTLRFSFSTTNKEKENISDPISYFKTISPYITKFYYSCINNEIIPFPSCNTIPLCCLNTNDKKALLKIFYLSKRLGYDSMPLIYFSRCEPVIDIFPDLSSIRCFGFPKTKRESILKFESISQLKEYYSKNSDMNKSVFLNSNKKCLNCEYKKLKSCKLCLTYKNKGTKDEK